ncbi:SDR family oxidoreductase [Tropicibacter sp. R16_0]|uniref:SDR family oxidoreductase n=1 Tax=Tropicibacter sp. R16_0 TaxID=2821102 RepID=UPI001ADC5CF1|nr:SDR family oxidoreductase [Tropicibacter sp. R16_0]
MSKTILITGAGAGLGKGAAFELARQGHRVIATTHCGGRAEKLKAEAAEQGLTLETVKLGITNVEDCQAAFARFGAKVDVVVANAAIGDSGPVAEVDVDRIRNVFEFNVFSTVEFVQPYAQVFARRRRGKVIFVSSVAGVLSYPYLVPYTASKHALEAIAELMREELQPMGVQVATLNLGTSRTEFDDRMYDKMDEWYDPATSITPPEAIRNVRDLFAGDELQMDPQPMIDKMAEVIAADNHKFRTVFPERAIKDAQDYQQKYWTLEV